MFATEIYRLSNFLSVDAYFFGDLITLTFIAFIVIVGVKSSANWATILIAFIIVTLIFGIIGLDSNFNIVTIIRDFITGEVDIHTTTYRKVVTLWIL